MQVTEQTQSLKKADEKYLWHAMRGAAPSPTNLIITKAEGAWVTDIDGNRYLDGMSGLWCVNVGYGRKELARAAFEQLEEMPYFPLTQSHVPAIKKRKNLSRDIALNTE